MSQTQCSTVGTLTALAAPYSVTGAYVESVFCPASCGSICRYGCLYCADGSWLGLYGSNNQCANVGVAAQGVNGSLVFVAGTALLASGTNEMYTCTAGNVYLVKLGPGSASNTNSNSTSTTKTGCLGWTTSTGCHGSVAGIVVGISIAVICTMAVVYRMCLRKRVYEEGQKSAVSLVAVTVPSAEYTVKQ